MQVLHANSAFPNNGNDLLRSVGKLAMAGERAVFTVEQMIRLLNAGFTVECLIDLIVGRLNQMGLVDSDTTGKEYRI